MILDRILTIFPLAGLQFAGLQFPTIWGDYRSACQAVETVISNASDVYYPGEDG